MEQEGDGDINCNGCTWNNPQTIHKKTWLGNKTSEDYSDYRII